MSKLVFAFPLLVIALIAIAIYVQVTSSTLSLPISTATTVLTILLPLFAAANVIYTPFLNRLAASPTLQQLLLPALHIIQGVLTVIIATLAAQGFVPGRTLGCRLEGNWQQLWRNHDRRAIERIQDTFDCCKQLSKSFCSCCGKSQRTCFPSWASILSRSFLKP
ncbi:hypothetical protein F5B21DRAFT_99175 [Xylaria acuta]|nr:hypothetical protein F5B21DRAFT_99175 [Xylaria acuta]